MQSYWCKICQSTSQVHKTAKGPYASMTYTTVQWPRAYESTAPCPSLGLELELLPDLGNPQSGKACNPFLHFIFPLLDETTEFCNQHLPQVHTSCPSALEAFVGLLLTLGQVPWKFTANLTPRPHLASLHFLLPLYDPRLVLGGLFFVPFFLLSQTCHIHPIFLRCLPSAKVNPNNADISHL